MSDIKPGMLVKFKTTGEPAFVLDIHTISGPHVLAGALSGVLARVRRPTADDKGAVTHKVEEYLIEELETNEDAAMRQVEEMNALKASFKATQTPSETTGNLFGSN